MARSERRQPRSAEYRAFMGALYVLGAVGFLSSISPTFMSVTATVVVVGFAVAAALGLVYGAFVLISDAAFSAWLRADNARLLAEAAERDSRDDETEDQAEPVGGVEGEH